MARLESNDLRVGVKIIHDGAPCVIVSSDFVKPGKGQAFVRVKIKNLLTGRVLEQTYKSGDTVEAADVEEKPMQYLYNDGSLWYFMVPDSYEQYEVSDSAVGDAKKWIKEGDECMVVLWNETPIAVVPPTFVELEVIETEPGFKGDTVSGATKPAKLETGAVIKVPLFINVGDKLKIDTRTGEYVSRVK